MPITLAINAMGTRFELVLAGGYDTRLRAAGEAALSEIDECHRLFNLFDPGSRLNTINRRAGREPVALDDLTYGLLQTCSEVHTASAGAFDVTVAPLMQALGFRGEQTQGCDPDEARAARDCVGMRHVVLDPATHTVRFAKPDVTLDLGGIAKGFAIDQAVGVLKEAGVSCALLHGGTSTVAALGTPPGEDGWRVALKTSSVAGDETDLPTVLLKDETLSISAPHGRTVQSNGQTYGHVLDPRTGKPAACGPFAGAAGTSACLTDAWATALLVLGEAPTGLPHTLRPILPDNLTQRTTHPPLAEALA